MLNLSPSQAKRRKTTGTGRMRSLSIVRRYNLKTLVIGNLKHMHHHQCTVGNAVDSRVTDLAKFNALLVLRNRRLKTFGFGHQFHVET